MPTVFYLTPLGTMPRNLSSYTVAGAVIWALSMMGEDVDSLIQDQSFRVSSPFPYFISEKGERIKLVPKPSLPFRSGRDHKGERNKKAIKKLGYLELGILNDLISGKITYSKIVEETGSRFKIKGNALLINDTAARISVVSRERNSINRMTSRAEEFFLSYGAMYENAGLYFIVQGSNRWIDATKAAVRFLEERGIGGEISIGQGHFKAHCLDEEWPFVEPEDPDLIMTLSLYAPTPEEWRAMCKNKDRLYYTLVRRAGRSSDGKLKKSVYFLGEGSIIPLTEANGRHEYVSQNPKAVAWGHPLYLHMKHPKGSKPKEGTF